MPLPSPLHLPPAAAPDWFRGSRILGDTAPHAGGWPQFSQGLAAGLLRSPPLSLVPGATRRPSRKRQQAPAADAKLDLWVFFLFFFFLKKKAVPRGRQCSFRSSLEGGSPAPRLTIPGRRPRGQWLGCHRVTCLLLEPPPAPPPLRLARSRPPPPPACGCSTRGDAAGCGGTTLPRTEREGSPRFPVPAHAGSR